MSDENISVSVEDSAVDSAIAKLDGALDKLSQLQGQMAVLGPDALTPAAPARAGSVGVVGSVAGVGAGVAGLSTAQATVDKLKGEVSETKSSIVNLVNFGKSSDIKGLQSATYRITRMLPGLREGHRLAIGLKNISLGNVVGFVSLATLIISIAQQVANWFEEQRRQQEEFKQAVMQSQNFTTTVQFQQWERQQKQAIENYRNGVIP